MKENKNTNKIGWISLLFLRAGIFCSVLIWVFSGALQVGNFPEKPQTAKAATALTAYLSGTADTGGVLTTANKILTTTGTEASKTTKIGKSLNYCELDGQGTNTSCSSVGSLPAPTGNGFIYDVTTLEGQYFDAGNWTGAMKLAASASGITATGYMRVYKRSSGGVYTAIASSSAVSASIGTIASPTTLSFSAGSGVATQFSTGDKLYIDFWVKITVNGPNSNTTTMYLYENGTAEYMTTPGYQPVVTTLGNNAGSEPSNVTLYPSGSVTDLDNFTFNTNFGTDTVTAITVTLAPAGAYNNIAQVNITDASNTAECTAATNPASNTVSLTGCSISVTTSPTTYKIRITPKTYANMPAYGSSYAVTGTVTGFTSTATQTGSDTGSATVTVDNSYPNSATAVSGSAGTSAVTLNWTTSNSGSFATTNGSVVLRWSGSSAGNAIPSAGTTNYAAGNTIVGGDSQTATVACVISSSASTALSKVDGGSGSAGCTATALTSGQAYTYKVFQLGVNGNYDQGVAIGSFTIIASLPTVTTQAATSMTSTTATGNGNITATGGANADTRGFVYDTASKSLPGNTAPASSGYAFNVSASGSFGTGAFTTSLTGLGSGVTYYVRAFAHNSAGYSYGNEVSFVTTPAAPTGVSATDGTYTDKVTITWTKSSGATTYHLWRDGVDLGAVGDVATYDDTGANAPTITAGAASASDGTSAVQVDLIISGASANNGTTHTYKVTAYNATGASPDSITDTGYRGVGSLTYQWQRSAADSDASYSDIAGATTATYADTGAPADGSGRYYKVVLNATGAAQQSSVSDRGYKMVASLTAIYRSVGPGATTALATGASNALTISGSTATFASALPNNVGVGDALLYDSDNNGSIDAIAFISSRTDSTHYTVQAANGSAPTATAAADNDWKLYRAYTSLANAEAGKENSGIAALLGTASGVLANFDDWTGGGDATTDDVGKDLVAANQQWNIALYANGSTADTASVTISDWTTGTDNYIRIYTPVSASEVGTSQRHSGVWNDAVYHLMTNNTNGIINQATGTRVDGLQIAISGETAEYYYATIKNVQYVSNNILKGDSTYSSVGLNYDTALGNIYVYNNLFYNFIQKSLVNFYTVRLDYNPVYFYNNTIASSTSGVMAVGHTGTSIIAKNNLLFGVSSPATGAFVAGTDYNATDNSAIGYTVTGGGNTHDKLSQTFAFVSATSSDYHLALTDTVAQNNGVNLSADPNLPFTTDIDGARHVDSWDIGADEAPTETVGLVMQDCTGQTNCYTSLSAWQAAYGGINFTGCAAGDLLCVNKIATAKIDGAWNAADTTKVVVSGWNTGSQNYVNIYTTSSARAAGKYDAAKYRLEVPAWYTSIFGITSNFVRITGLQMAQTATSSGTSLLTFTPSSAIAQLNMDSVLIYKSAGTTNGRGVDISKGTLILRNSIIYGVHDEGVFFGYNNDSSLLTAILENNTIVNNGKGISGYYTSTNSRVKNTYVGNNTTDFGSGLNVTFQNCVTATSTAPSGVATGVAFDTLTGAGHAGFVSITTGSEDFHIKSGSALQGAGLDLGGEGWNTDIDGQTRTAPWDIGADQYVAVGITISGSIYDTDGVTLLSVSGTARIAVGNGSTISNSSAIVNGNFTFTNIPLTGDGQVVTIYIYGSSTLKSSLVFEYGDACSGYDSCMELKLIKNRVTLQSFGADTSITNADLSACDNDSGSGNCASTDIGFTSNGGALILTFSNNTLYIPSGTAFAPGGNVTAQNLDIAGFYIGATEILALTGTNSPLAVSGTFSAGSNTVSFKGTAGTITIPSIAFNNLDFSPASGSPIFKFSSGASGWYNPSWYYRKAIAIDHTKIASSTGETYANFPVLIRLTDSDLKTSASSTGADILFTSANGTTKLNHEIEQYDSSTGSLIAWVNVGADGLSTTTDTTLYMYYGNPSAASQQEATSTWGEYYGVWHMDDNVANKTVAQSTANNETGTAAANTSTKSVAGKIGRALSFDGATDRVDFSFIDTGTTQTASYWLDWQDDSDGIVLGGNFGYYATYMDTTNIYYSAGPGNYVYVPHGTLTSGTFNYFSVVRNGGTITFYKNGSQLGTPQALSIISTPLALATFAQYTDGSNGQYPTRGGFDEVRLSTAARSADWIATEYNNQNSPLSFITGGTQQLAASGNVSMLGDLSIGGMATVDALTNNIKVSVNGNFSIGSSASYSAASTSLLTVIGNFTNNGTFTANSGTVVFGNSSSSLGGSWQSYDTTANGSIHPNNVAVDSLNNKIYVADNYNNVIIMYDSGSGGTTLGSNAQTISGLDYGFNSVTGIAVDAANNKIYVVDGSTNMIFMYDSGTGGTIFGGNAQTLDGYFLAPTGIAVDSINNRVYVANTSDSHVIVSFDSGSNGSTFGANVQTMGGSGTGDFQFGAPYDIAVDSTNNKVYVIDVMNNRVSRFDSGSGGTVFGGGPWQTFGTGGQGAGQFDASYGIDVDSISNKVYVADTGNSRVVSFDSGSSGTTFGNNWQTFGTNDSMPGVGLFSAMKGIGLDSTNHKIYVADTDLALVDMFDSISGSGSPFTSTISGATTFYNLSDTVAGSTLKFVHGQTFTIAGTLTVTGVSGNLVSMVSDSAGQQWTVHFNSPQAAGNITYAYIKDSGCDGTSQNADVSDGTSVDGTNNGTCWVFSHQTSITISGTVYNTDGISALLAADAIKLAVGGSTFYTATTSAANGGFSFANVTQPSSGNIITVWLSTGAGADKASLIFKQGSATGNIIGLTLVKNRVILDNSQSGGSLTNTDLSACDNDSGSACSSTDIGFASNGGALAATFATNVLQINTGTTFAPGGNVTVQKLNIAGTYTGGSETLKLTGSGTGANRPLVNTGTFIAGTGTVEYVGTSTTDISSSSVDGDNVIYNNLTLDPAATATYNLGAANPQTVAVTGSTTIGNGTNYVTVTAATYNPTVNFKNLSMVTNGYLTEGASNINISGNFTNAGGRFNTNANGKLIFNGGITQTITVDTMDYGVAQVSAGPGNSLTTLAQGGNYTHFTKLTIDAGQTYDIAGKTLYVSGSGTGANRPFINNGTLGSTGSFEYTGSGTVEIEATIYPAFLLYPAAAGSTYILGTAPGQTITFGDFYIGNGTTSLTLDASTYNPNLNISNRMYLNNNVTFIKGTGVATAKSGATVYYYDYNAVKQDFGILRVSASGTATTLYLSTSAKLTSLVVDSSQKVTFGGAYTLTLTGSGTGALRPLISGGAFTIGSGTIEYTGTSATDISNVTSDNITYKNLILDPAATTTYNLGTASSQTLAVTGDLTVGNGVNAVTVTANTTNPIINVTGNFSLATSSIFTAAPASALTISGNFANNGTFNSNGGTVVLAGAGTSNVSGTSTAFNNFTVTTPGKTIQFHTAASNPPVYTFAGTFTITGTSGSFITIQSDLTGTQWLAHFNSAQSSVTYAIIKDSGCDAGSADVNLTNTSTSQGNNGACWKFAAIIYYGGGGGNTIQRPESDGGGTPVGGGSSQGGDNGNGDGGSGGGTPVGGGTGQGGDGGGRAL